MESVLVGTSGQCGRTGTTTQLSASSRPSCRAGTGACEQLRGPRRPSPLKGGLTPRQAGAPELRHFRLCAVRTPKPTSDTLRRYPPLQALPGRQESRPRCLVGCVLQRRPLMPALDLRAPYLSSLTRIRMWKLGQGVTRPPGMPGRVLMLAVGADIQ